MTVATPIGDTATATARPTKYMQGDFSEFEPFPKCLITFDPHAGLLILTNLSSAFVAGTSAGMMPIVWYLQHIQTDESSMDWFSF